MAQRRFFFVPHPAQPTEHAPTMPTRFDLVAAPWMRADLPSMAIARLRASLSAAGHHGDDHFASLRWLRRVADRHGEHGLALYEASVDSSSWLGVGAWVFSRAYWADTAGDAQRDREYLALVEAHTHLSGDAVDAICADVWPFALEEAERILDRSPDVVGFTTTFHQTYPSLVIARAVKELRPDLPIVLGGANCDGEMGAALLAVHPELDFVVSGEGERAVVALCSVVAGDADPAEVAGLSWRGADGSVATASAPGQPIDLDELPMPDHDAFFAQFDASGLAGIVNQPSVIVETARGCWWGAMKHCTFCGLNGASMAFRSERGERACRQIVDTVRRHGVPNVVVADQIMDRDYFETMLPDLAALDADLSIFYEIRADVTIEEVRALTAAGVRAVQPGIESLGTNTLRLMRKSSTGSKHVQVLRAFHDEGVTVSWNYLYGFPGEEWERDYAPVVAQMPNLVHLSPPEASRIALQRFSPNFTDPSFGFRPYGPPEFSEHLHPGLTEDQVLAISYGFTTAPRGITEAEAAVLHDACAHWRDHHRTSTLRWRRHADGVVVQDRRSDREPVDHLLDDVEAAVWHLLDTPVRAVTVAGALAERGVDASPERVGAIVDAFAAAGLVFTDGTTFVRIANEARRALRPARPRTTIPVLVS